MSHGLAWETSAGPTGDPLAPCWSQVQHFRQPWQNTHLERKLFQLLRGRYPRGKGMWRPQGHSTPRWSKNAATEEPNNVHYIMVGQAIEDRSWPLKTCIVAKHLNHLAAPEANFCLLLEGRGVHLWWIPWGLRVACWTADWRCYVTSDAVEGRKDLGCIWIPYHPIRRSVITLISKALCSADDINLQQLFLVVFCMSSANLGLVRLTWWTCANIQMQWWNPDLGLRRFGPAAARPGFPQYSAGWWRLQLCNQGAWPSPSAQLQMNLTCKSLSKSTIWARFEHWLCVYYAPGHLPVICSIPLGWKCWIEASSLP